MTLIAVLNAFLTRCAEPNSLNLMFRVCSAAQSCPTLWDPEDCSPPSSSVCGILQPRVLEWVAMSFSRASSRPRDQIRVSCVSWTAGFLTTEPLGKPYKNQTDRRSQIPEVKVSQLCPTLCDPRACSPPDSSVHGILQARILEWVAIPFSRDSSWPRNWTWVYYIAGRFFTIWATRESRDMLTPSS